MPLLELDNAGVRIGETALVDGVSLALEPGETLGVVGVSGAGKTLLALRLSHLLPKPFVATGTVRFEGRELPNDEPVMARLRGRRIGLLCGDGRMALDRRRSIGVQVDDAIAAAGGGSAAELLVPLGLSEVASRYPEQVDADAQRRTLLALTVAAAPDVVIADEPCHGLDTVAARRLLEMLSELQKARGFALLLLARDYRAIAMTVERAMVLAAGRVVESGLSEVLFGRPQHDHTRALVAASRLRMRTLTRPPIGAELLRVDGLRLDGERREPLVNVALRRGETLAIVGRAGSGKTRLAHVVAGLAMARAGSVTFEGERYRGADLPQRRRREISLVFSDAAASFDGALPIGAALAEPLRLEPQLLHEEQGDRLLEVVRAVGLDAASLIQRPGAFDRPTLVRFALARALIARPTLVVLDDPGRDLDPVQRNGLLELLARMRSDFGLSYLILTRDIEMARDLGDRVLVLDGGAIAEEGKPHDIIDAPANPATQALMAARLPEVYSLRPSGAAMGTAP